MSVNYVTYTYSVSKMSISTMYGSKAKNGAAIRLLTLAICTLVLLSFAPGCSEIISTPTPLPPPVLPEPPITEPPAVSDNQSSTVAETPPAAEPSDETWYQVASFEGTVSETTPQFHIYGTEWHLNWAVDADDLATAILKLDIYTKAEPFAVWHTVSSNGASSDTVNFFMSGLDKRDFFIKVTALNLSQWTMNIEDNAIAATSYPVKITYIHYRGTLFPPDPTKGICIKRVEPDEYVVIKNLSECAVELSGWTLKNISKPSPQFKFPPSVILPGGIIRVYTDEVHPETGGLTFYFGTGDIWSNDNPDIAVLYDAQGNEVSRKSYTLPMKLNEEAP